MSFQASLLPRLRLRRWLAVLPSCVVALCAGLPIAVGAASTPPDSILSLAASHAASDDGCQPCAVTLSPCAGGVVVDDVVAQRQLAQALASAHQIAAQRLAGADEISVSNLNLPFATHLRSPPGAPETAAENARLPSAHPWVGQRRMAWTYDGADGKLSQVSLDLESRWTYDANDNVETEQAPNGNDADPDTDGDHTTTSSGRTMARRSPRGTSIRDRLVRRNTDRRLRLVVMPVPGLRHLRNYFDEIGAFDTVALSFTPPLARSG